MRLRNRKSMASASSSNTGPENKLLLQSKGSSSGAILESEKAKLLNDAMLSTTGKSMANLPVDASDLANFLTMDRNTGYNCGAQALLRSVIAEKQELCFSVVSLLWHKLIAAPETQMSPESTSAQQGWRQVHAFPSVS